MNGWPDTAGSDQPDPVKELISRVGLGVDRQGQQGAGRLYRGLKGVSIAPLEVAVYVLGSVQYLDHDRPFGMVKVKEMVLFFQQMGYAIVLSCVLPCCGVAGLLPGHCLCAPFRCLFIAG